jgi:hypothetical protein
MDGHFGRGTAYFLALQTPWWVTPKGQLIVQDKRLHIEDKTEWAADEDIFPLGVVCSYADSDILLSMYEETISDNLRGMNVKVEATSIELLLKSPDIRRDAIAVLVACLDVPARWVYLSRKAFSVDGAQGASKCALFQEAKI